MSAIKEQYHDEIEARQRIKPKPRKESPILFSTPMVLANLEGRKNQTRRLTGLEVINQNPDHWKFESKWRTVNHFWDPTKEESPNPLKRFFVFTNKNSGKEVEIRCRYGDKKGDLIWVRETFIQFPEGEFNYKTEPHPVFEQAKTKWKPSIHMPKSASRIWLEFQEATVERLQDISETDAKAEGMEPGRLIGFGAIGQSTFREGFFNIWLTIHGYESLHQNPWVLVIKYKVISTTGKENIQN